MDTRASLRETAGRITERQSALPISNQLTLIGRRSRSIARERPAALSDPFYGHVYLTFFTLINYEFFFTLGCTDTAVNVLGKKAFSLAIAGGILTRLAWGEVMRCPL